MYRFIQEHARGSTFILNGCMQLFTVMKHFKCLGHFTQRHINHRGGADINCMALLVGVTPMGVGRLGDVSDGTIACMPDEMPGFI